ncbi:MAG: hypothetical protein AAGH60_05625 [Pseudomonadota bacterium]
MAVFSFSEPQRVLTHFPLQDRIVRTARSCWQAISSSRMRQARREVNAYLMSLDDATLSTYGVDRLMSRAARSRPSAP